MIKSNSRKSNKKISYMSILFQSLSKALCTKLYMYHDVLYSIVVIEKQKQQQQKETGSTGSLNLKLSHKWVCFSSSSFASPAPNSFLPLPSP
jgi:hypothetical protein